MKKKVADNLGKFFYDCGKLSFALLVIGVLSKKPFVLWELVFGIAFTMLFLAAGVTIDLFKEE